MLVINADDFGMKDDINRAILCCFEERICTSTTIMPNMYGFDEACALSFENDIYKKVGMHLVLNEGAPITSDIRKESRFCNSEGDFCLSRKTPIFSFTTREQHALAAEIRGQIRKCRKQGIPISHVDSHHHFHTEWGIAKVLFPIVREERIPFVRIAWNLVKNPEISKRLYKLFFNFNLRRMKLCATDYFGTIDQYFLFLASNRGMDRTIELMIHPKYKGGKLYVTDSIEATQYVELMRQHLVSEGVCSFYDLNNSRQYNRGEHEVY